MRIWEILLILPVALLLYLARQIANIPRHSPTARKVHWFVGWLFVLMVVAIAYALIRDAVFHAR